MCHGRYFASVVRDGKMAGVDWHFRPFNLQNQWFGVSLFKICNGRKIDFRHSVHSNFAVYLNFLPLIYPPLVVDRNWHTLAVVHALVIDDQIGKPGVIKQWLR